MRWVLAAGFAGALAFVLSHPAMLGWPEAAYPGWDLTRVFWADLEFARSALARGELPLWNPLDRAGYPFLAEPQSGMFDGLTWVLVALALIIGYAPAWLIVLKAVLCFGIGAAGIAAYLRHRGLPPWVWTWAALALVLCPRFDKLKDQSALWPAVWIGWLLLACDRWAQRPTWRTGLWLALAVAAVVNAGYPPTGFRLGLLVAPYLLAVVWTQGRRAEDRRAYVTALSKTALLVLGVVVVLCSGQVWSTLQVLGETKRAGLDLSFVTASRTKSEHVLGLFAPSTSKQALNLYVSFAGVVGAVFAMTRPRPVTVVFAVIAVAGFVLGCGDDLPVLPVLAELPGFRSFRIAGHYLMLTSIALVLLAALGLGDLAALPPEDRRRRYVLGATLLAALIAFFGLGSSASAVSKGVAVASAVALFALALASKGRAAVGWVLVGLTCLDLGVAARPVAEILQPLPDRARGYAMAEYIDRSLEVRVADYEWAGKRIGPREGIRDFNGHRPALTDPRYMMVYEAAPNSAPLLRAMNVGLFGVRATNSRAIRQSGMQRVRELPGVYVVEDPWPNAFFTTNVRVVPTAEAALQTLRRARTPTAVFETADLPPGVAVRNEEVSPVTHARVVERAYASMTVEVEAPHAGVLVVTESYEAGWRATVDGEPVPLRRVNLIARAVAVSAGPHRVELHYRPPGARLLWWLWLLALAASIGLLWKTRRMDA